MGRFPANCFVFSLFPSFFLRFFPFSLFPFFFFFSAARCPRALDRSFWLWQRCRPLSISRMKTRKSRSNLAIGRCLSLLILSPAGNWRKAIFTGGGERERERSDLSRNDSLECNKRARAVDEGTLLRQLWKFLLAFFEGSFVATRRRPYPSCATTSRIRLSTFSNGRIFCFESVVSRTGAFTFPLSRDRFSAGLSDTWRSWDLIGAIVAHLSLLLDRSSTLRKRDGIDGNKRKISSHLPVGV